MPGALLDTHALFWLVSGLAAMSDEALVAVGENQRDGTLYVSPITAWELAVAAQKPASAGRPDLSRRPARIWFRDAITITGARLTPVNQLIALEAAEVASTWMRKDPGDCFLIATARVRRVPLITRDRSICQLARDRPDYLSVIVC